jgi:transposase
LLETRAKPSGTDALIEHLQLVIAKMRRGLFGPRSERSQRLLDQLELQLKELAAAAGEHEAKADTASIPMKGFVRRSKTRRNFPGHLPRRRIAHLAPTCYPCCGGTKLSKIGEDVTETLDVVPRQLFVTEHVREKFSYRSCEKIAQPPAPSMRSPGGFAGPSLLAMILVDKYADHRPLNRQSEQFAREGVELSISTLADHVGACAAMLLPLAKSDPLCTSLLSVGKHWKHVFFRRATRATLSNDCSFHPVRLQISGTDLVWCASYHLFSGQHASLDQESDHVAADAKVFCGFRLRQPFSTFFRGPIGMNVAHATH